jgi:hypothetical protein
MATIYTKHELRLIAATDGTSYKTKVFQRDDTDTHQSELSSANVYVSGTVTIDTGDGDVTISLGDIDTATMVYIKTSGAITLDWALTGGANDLAGLPINGEFFWQGSEGASVADLVIATAGTDIDVTYFVAGTEA